jgi:hypothetical protein
LLLVPLQLRFRALGAVLIVLYLDAVVVSLTAGRSWPRLRWLLLIAGVGALILRTAPIADPDVARLCYMTSRVVVVVVLGACVLAALDYVLRSTDVTVDRIFAAIVVAQAGSTVSRSSSSISASSPSPRWDTVISPRLPLAQMLAALEAVAGQFYIAVVIAWLVSVHATHRRPAA